MFIGYDESETTAEILALVRDGDEVDEAEAGETVQALFDGTPFYAESGGQAGDRGEVEWAGGARPRCSTPRSRPATCTSTRLKITRGSLAARRRACAWRSTPSGARARAPTTPPPTWCTRRLRHVLGPHVAQKGQLVDGDRMRFDFSHGAPLTADEIDAIEAEVNAVIRQNLPADTREMAPEAAIEAGAMALFGEKYGDACAC